MCFEPAALRRAPTSASTRSGVNSRPTTDELSLGPVGLGMYDGEAVRQELLHRLTRRQRDVLELLAKGLTNEEIGAVLGIGAATVKTHVRGIFTTLGVENRTEATWLLNQDDPGLSPEFERRPAIAVLA